MYEFKPFKLTEIPDKINNIKSPTVMFPSIVNNNKFIYLHGNAGSNSASNPANCIWEFNLATETWKSLKNKFIFRKMMNGGIGFDKESNRLICTESWNDVDRPHYIRVFDLHNAENDFEMKTPDAHPSFQVMLSGVHNLINHGNYLYMAECFKEIKIFRLEKETWTWRELHKSEQLARWDSEPYIGENLFMYNAFDGKKIYVFLIGDVFMKNIISFDLETFKWECIEAIGDPDHVKGYPEYRTGSSFCEYTDPDSGHANIIVSGGKISYHYYDDIWRMNLHTLQWTCLSKFGSHLPRRTDYHASTVTKNGKLYLYGGSLISPGKRGFCNSLHSVWMRIPTLEDICWDAVEHYFGNLSSKSSDELKEMGLPLNLIKNKYV